MEWKLCDLMSCPSINENIEIGLVYKNRNNLTLPYTKKEWILEKWDSIEVVSIDDSKEINSITFKVLSWKYKWKNFCFSSMIFIWSFAPELIVLENQNKSSIKSLESQKEKLKKILSSKKIKSQSEEIKSEVNFVLKFIKKALSKIKE